MKFQPVSFEQELPESIQLTPPPLSSKVKKEPG
jgi:hypothetical protein